MFILFFYLIFFNQYLVAQDVDETVKQNDAATVTSDATKKEVAAVIASNAGLNNSKYDTVSTFCNGAVTCKCNSTDEYSNCTGGANCGSNNNNAAACANVADCTYLGPKLAKLCAKFKALSVVNTGLTGIKKFGLDKMLGLVDNVTGGGGGAGDCQSTCRNQVKCSRGIVQCNLPSVGSFDNFYNSTAADEKKMLNMCMCQSSCFYGDKLTKETCDVLTGAVYDCKLFAEGTEDRATCDCQQLANKTSMNYVYDTSKKLCDLNPVEPETVDPDSGFGGDSEPSFGAGKDKPTTADAKKDDKKDAAAAAAVAAGGAAGASGKAGSFSKDNKWKSPYRKDDGIFRTQEGYARAGGLQGGRYSNLKPTKDESKFIPKSVAEAEKPKDIYEVKDSIFDEISKTYEDGVTANAFMYVATNEKTSKSSTKNKTSKSLKRVKR